MPGPVEDTWAERDLPVLQEAVRGVDDQPITGVRFDIVAEATGLTVDDVYRASRALRDAGLVDVAGSAPMPGSRFNRISAEARLITGAWPTTESAADRIVAALEAIIDNTDELEDTRGRARRILDSFGGAGRDLTLAVAAAAITGQMPR